MSDSAVCMLGPNGRQVTPSEYEEELVDRFGAFLALRGAIARRVDDGTYVKGQRLPAWQRYALRLSAWRIANVPRLED